MRRLVFIGVALLLSFSLSVSAFSDEPESVDIFLDDEELDVEADIPSVDLVLTFKGMRYESIEPRKTFLPELYESVERAPF